MGAGNVARVYARWGHLEHRPFRLLAFMALVTLDADAEPRYWGGVDALVEALGRPLPALHRDHVAVSTTLTALVRHGAISRAVTSARGRRAEYLLHLEAVDNTCGRPLTAVPTDQPQADERTSLRLTTDQPQADSTSASGWSQGVLGGRGTQGGTTSPQVGNPPADDPASAQCPICKWLPTYGHAPGCQAGAA